MEFKLKRPTMKVLQIAILFLFISLSTNAQEDVPGSKDFDLLERMPNYSISKYVEEEFGSLKLYFNSKTTIKEGRKTEIDYRHNDYKDKNVQKPSRLQLIRNYSQAIEKAGGTVLFERKVNWEKAYYTYKRANGQVVWVMIKTNTVGGGYSLEIIEEELMRQDVHVNEELIKNSIDISGKIAIYGIFFDVGKSIIKPESKPSLEQIAAYLKNNPSVNCWVVGHTDSDGSFELNSKLSLERARAIKVDLEQNYSVPTGRLYAEGVGPLAPLASNSTEEGKKQNRRVELVKK